MTLNNTIKFRFYGLDEKIAKEIDNNLKEISLNSLPVIGDYIHVSLIYLDNCEIPDLSFFVVIKRTLVIINANMDDEYVLWYIDLNPVD